MAEFHTVNYTTNEPVEITLAHGETGFTVTQQTGKGPASVVSTFDDWEAALGCAVGHYLQLRRAVEKEHNAYMAALAAKRGEG